MAQCAGCDPTEGGAGERVGVADCWKTSRRSRGCRLRVRRCASGIAYACARVVAAMCSISRSPDRSQPSKLSNRITKARSTSALFWMTIRGATWPVTPARPSLLLQCRGSRAAPARVGRAQACGRARILVAGIGNIFHGRRRFRSGSRAPLAQRESCPRCGWVDFGIRGFDLAYALQDGYETMILIDAYPHGDEPGTLYVVEPDLNGAGFGAAPKARDIDAHGMDPVKILRLAAAMGGRRNGFC